MSYKGIVFSVFLILTTLVGNSLDNPERLFEKGNKAYRDKAYLEAVKLYDSLYNAGYQSENLFFNLGNAHYQLNQIPESIWFYEKAQKISGYRKDIEYNLSLAQQQIPDKVTTKTSTLFKQWWNTAIRYFSLSSWGMITVILAWVSIFGLAGFLLLPIYWLKRISLTTGILGLAIFALSFLMTVERHQYTNGNQNAVIFDASVYVKSAPDKESEDLFILHGGTKVALKDELDDWRQVRLPDGKQGWIRESTLKPI